MDKLTVYVESSIFSTLVERPSKDPRVTARQLTTRIWWQNDADAYTLFASDIVQLEARQGDPEMARLRLAYIASIPRLSGTRESARLADGLIDAGILPQEPERTHFIWELPLSTRLISFSRGIAGTLRMAPFIAGA